jgi:hypothetical protein
LVSGDFFFESGGTGQKIAGMTGFELDSPKK